MSGERCGSHDEIVMDMGKVLSAAEEHGRQLIRLFEYLDDIKTAVDQNCVRAQHRDDAVIDLRQAINGVDRKIENGLKAEVAKCVASIAKVMACIDRHQAERIHKSGLRGFIEIGWAKFKEQAAVVMMTGLAALLAWYVVGLLQRLAHYSGGAEGIYKLFFGS